MSALYYVYDLETFVNCFLFTGKFVGSNEYQVFEISDRKNEREQLVSWLSYLKNANSIMVGYNNLAFDYPIIHDLLQNPFTFDATKAVLVAQQIIQSQNGYGFNQMYYMDRLIPQLDVMKINHFDNKAKRTRLKDLQFAMRSESVEDMPSPWDVPLDGPGMEALKKYNLHDVTETEKFFTKCIKHVELRQELLRDKILTGDVLNYSDVKIGTEYLVKKIGRNKCYKGKEPIRTFRPEIHYKDIILPKIFYRTEEYQEVLDWFKKQVIYAGDENGTPKLKTKLANIEFNFGVGGVHASVENRFYQSTKTHVIKDIDVSGMYVAVAIANGFFPEHLGQDFNVAYKQLQRDRAQYPKGSTMNLVLKLAGNGVFGNSDNEYSCFYDPRYPKQVTINGQLQLLQLAEMLSLIPGLEIIQCNTDGITAIMPREIEWLFGIWKADWEKETGLKLEEVEYEKMWIRDVNNYAAIDTKGKLKRKGAYAYPEKDEDYWGGSGSEWHKDFSNMVAQKAVEQVHLHGYLPEDVVRLFVDPFDFMIRYKTTGSSQVFIGDQLMPKTLRYYVSTAGAKGIKRDKPKGKLGAFKRKNKLTDAFYAKILSEIPEGTWDERIHTKNKSIEVERVTSIESGRLIKECNHIKDFNWNDVDYSYYVDEIKKLIIGAANV